MSARPFSLQTVAGEIISSCHLRSRTATAGLMRRGQHSQAPVCRREHDYMRPVRQRACVLGAGERDFPLVRRTESPDESVIIRPFAAQMSVSPPVPVNRAKRGQLNYVAAPQPAEQEWRRGPDRLYRRSDSAARALSSSNSALSAGRVPEGIWLKPCIRIRYPWALPGKLGKL